MSKPALGRGLSALLGETKATVQGDSDAGARGMGGSEIKVGRGFGTLLKGEREDGSGPLDRASADFRAANGSGPLPTWYLFAGDLALVAMAFALVGSDGAPGWRLFLAVVALALGGVLAVLGVLRWRAGQDEEVVATADEWVLVRQGGADEERGLIVRTTAPVFVGEVQRSFGGKIQIVPLAVHGVPTPSPVESRALVAAALEAHRVLAEEQARELRAALS